MVAQARKDVAAFGHTEETQGGLDPVAMQRAAEDALAQASGAAPFLRSSQDHAAEAFVTLFDGVRPFILQQSMAAISS
jgi:hypothetical protein